MRHIILRNDHNGFNYIKFDGPWYLFGDYLTSQDNEEDLLEILAATGRVLSGEVGEATLTDDYIVLTLNHGKMTSHLTMDKPNRTDYESEMPLQAFCQMAHIWYQYLKLRECMLKMS
jgi:hypothetical protein